MQILNYQMISSLEELVIYFQNKANTTGQASLFGIVTDSTFPLYRPSTKDYVSQITIIDQTISQSQYIFKVYLISQRPQPITMSEVGQVIYFSKFDYSIKGEHIVQGKPTLKSSIQRANEQTVSNRKNQNINYSNFKEMKGWFLSRFNQIYTPKIGIDKSILNEKVMVAKPFNLILKVKQGNKTNLGTGKSTITYKLIDDSGNQFGLQFPTYFENDSYVIIKNVTHVENNLHIVLNKQGNVMLLPQPKPYDYKAITSQKQEYNNNMVLTSIKYSFDIEETPYTYISELLNNIEQYKAGNRVISQTKQLIVTKDRQLQLQQQLLNVYPVTTSGGISLFNGTFFVKQDHLDRNILGLSNYTSKFNKKLWYVYRLTIWVKDLSIQNSNELFPLHLFSYDGKGGDFFPDIDLTEINNFLDEKSQQKQQLIEIDESTYDDYEKVSYHIKASDIGLIKKQKQKIEKKIQEWMNKLYERTDPLNMMSILVEPMYDKFDLRYRIVRTKLNYFEAE